MDIAVGQRWVSDSEPEMGLGMVLSIENGTVDILFPAVEQRRMYAVATAPLRRVVFAVGEQVLTHDDQELEVTEVREEGDVVVYVTADRVLEEGELSDSMSLNKPHDRLLGGAVDDDRNFRLRVESLYRNSQIKGSILRGFMGARADLIPHQMSIVSEVSKRVRPRVLLADEVGLGKTIEACMIMHRLHLTGRADRVLIVLPESLVHQWFVELLRRFNMMFSLFDEERCKAIEEHNAVNPFLDSQLVITSIDFLTANPHRSEQVLEAGWDMLIVDEAHHLEWSEEEVSAEYALVDKISSQTEAVLLLTATPQQLGPEGHFARLRLLDSDRFSDLKTYLQESKDYEAIAKLLAKLSKGELPTTAEVKKFSKNSSRVKEGMDALMGGDEEVRNQLIEDLLDGFGPGRVMFRNTRDYLSGFPDRNANLVEVEDGGKMKWLAGLIKELGLGEDGEKILLIVKTRAAAERIAQELQQEINVDVALFHEDLTLIQRDRNAAYFSDEEGAQVLLCSEIGSEGRNFQFAHHLVLYDLPDDPELLEQRIGRLDRIGQSEKIHIHVPYVAGSDGEVLARWYHEGLDAFEHNVHGATEVYRACGEMLELLKMMFSKEGMDDLISFSRKQMQDVKKKLMSGQEKLLALNSYRIKDSQKMIDRIEAVDGDPGFEKFTLKLLDNLGVGIEDLGPRSYLLTVSHLKTDLAADIPDEGLAVTFDRDYALSREDVRFISMDHPLVRSALDVMLAGESGNASFGVWEGSGEKGVYLEAYFVAEVVAPRSLHVDRFLSAKPVRVAVDHNLADASEDMGLRKVRLREGNLRKLLGNEMLKQKLIPAMMDKCEKLAEAKMAVIAEEGAVRIQEIMGAELSRLEDLAEINTAVSSKEIDQLKSQIGELEAAVKSARVRLDSLKLVWRT